MIGSGRIMEVPDDSAMARHARASARTGSPGRISTDTVGGRDPLIVPVVVFTVVHTLDGREHVVDSSTPGSSTDGPRLERRQGLRYKQHGSHLGVESSHVPMLSHPDIVLDAIRNLVTSV
jgi:hypothetical protein